MNDHLDVQIPGVNTLTGVAARALDLDGERGYLVRMGNPDGSTTNYITTQAGMEHLRQEVEKAMLSSMFG